jgi:hypothetical protein
MPIILEQTIDGKYPISSDCAQWLLNFVADMFPNSRGLLTLEEVDRLQGATMEQFSDDEIAQWSTPELTEHARKCFGFGSSWIRDENAAELEPVKRRAANMLDEVLAKRPRKCRGRSGSTRCDFRN